MRIFSIVLLILLVASIFAGGVFSCCKGSPATGRDNNVFYGLTDDETDDVAEESGFDSNDRCQYVPPVIPSFVKDKFGDGDWWADTICVVGNKAFYVAHSEYGKPSVIYNEDGIITYAPTLTIDSFASSCKYKFYVSIVGKTMLVDFSDASSLRTLPSLLKELSSFSGYSFDSIAGFGRSVSYSITVDFPKSSICHAKEIGRWLVEKIADSQQLNEDVPPLNAVYIGYMKRLNGGWRYKGDINDHRKIAQCAASVYFAMMKGEWGENDDDYPSCLFSTLYLQARVFNNRFVTYQQYTNDYNGGAHGYYTERLISFDHVHNQEIDYKYLFKPESEKELLNILLEEAKKTHQYSEWYPQITDGVVDMDEDGNPTGGYSFPRPGLSDEGLVFSFQPYDISCFAAGTFHFTIPYWRVRHLLTSRGKWCVGFDR